MSRVHRMADAQHHRRIHRGRWALACAVLALAGAGLATRADAKPVRVPLSQVPPSLPTAPESLAFKLDEFPYRIAPGDQLNVNFGIQLDGKVLETDVLVRPDGMITLNPIGDVRAAGLTPVELDSLLTRRYVNIFRDPNVTVGVLKVAGNFVHVLGQVVRPGSYEVNPNATVLQAIAQAGGFAGDASMGSVVLMRRTGTTSLVARKLQLDRAISQGISSQDAFVRRYDIVFVPRSAIGSVNRFVDQFFTKMIPVPQGYILGWEAFNLDRVFARPLEVRQ